MVAILEIDIYRVHHQKRAAVCEEVAILLGPSDPTIAITERMEGVSVPVDQLLDALRPFGEVVLVR